MIDGNEAIDDRFQGSAMLQDLSHTRDHALGNSAVWQIRRRAHTSDNVLTHCLQGCEQNLVLHSRGWEDKKRQEQGRRLFLTCLFIDSRHVTITVLLAEKGNNAQRVNTATPNGIINCFKKTNNFDTVVILLLSVCYLGQGLKFHLRQRQLADCKRN